MRSICLAVVFLLPCHWLTSAEPNAGRYDWPSWRGPDRTAISKEKGLLDAWPQGGPQLVWDTQKVNDVSIGRGYSSVAVADGRVYTMGNVKGDCYVFCFDEKTGKLLWSVRIGKSKGDGPRSTPTVDGDRVYVLSRMGQLACLDAQKGEIRWKVHYKDDLGGRMMSGWDYSESPLVDGDKLICTPGGDQAALVALNKNTGKVLWKSEIPKSGGSGYASPVIAEVGGVKQYITLLGRSKGIVGVRADDGKFLWHYNRMANGTANIPTPIVKGDLVFCSTGYGSGAALLQLIPKPNGGTDVKELYFKDGRTLQNHHGGMVLIGDYIYGGHGHNNGLPFCLNMKSGKFAWGPKRGPGQRSAAVVYADGHLYFRYQSGTMALIEATPEGYKLKGQFDLPRSMGTGWPHPVVVNGKLYLRGRDRILCYDIKKS